MSARLFNRRLVLPGTLSWPRVARSWAGKPNPGSAPSNSGSVAGSSIWVAVSCGCTGMTGALGAVGGDLAAEAA
eukprot:COSAG06_NODE_56027_length_286_cov_5.737968_1_plen_73_part_10